MESIQDLLRTAREIHAAGDVEGAIGIYEGDPRSREPDHAGVLHALGAS